MKTNRLSKVVIASLAALLIFTSVDAKTYYVKADATKKEKGTEKNPFKTIQQAVEVAMAGDTILVLEGVYRERVNPIRSGEQGAPIVFMGEPGRKVAIKGSDVWTPEWKELKEGIFFAQPDESMFNDIVSDYPDTHNPFEALLSSTPFEREGLQEVLRGWQGDSTVVYTCGQVFVNGSEFKEVAAIDELAEDNTWYYNPENSSIYVNFVDLQPADQEVEISTRRRIFAPTQRGLGHIVVQGFLMEHCGNQYPTNFWVEGRWGQRGALGIGAGHDWVIRRNVIRHVKTFAIDCGKIDRDTPNDIVVSNNIIEENYVIDNGAAGIASSSSLNMIIRNNVVMRNNTLFFTGSKRWEHSGIKCHSATNGYIHDNYVADNYLTQGIWMDNQFLNARITRNVIVNNGTYGVFLEMSDYGFDKILIDNNIIVGNRRNPIYNHDASGSTVMHNLLANTPSQAVYGQGIMIRQVTARTKSYHHSAFNNIFSGSLPMIEVCYPSHRGGDQRFDYNIYNTTKFDTHFHVSSACEKPDPWTPAEFYDKIADEVAPVGELKSEFRNDPIVRLTFDQWKYFWESHGCDNDKNSTLNDALTVVYQSTSQEVTIYQNIKPSNFKSKNHELIDVDFFGNPIPQNGKAAPGPFQNIQVGFNRYKVWNGLEIIGQNELPDFSEFNR